MTTIAFKDGFLAADSRAYSDGREPIGFKTKLFDLDDGGAVGISTSNVGYSERFVKWLNAGAVEADFPFTGDFHISALMIDKEGRVFLFKNSQYPTGPLRAPYFAVGTGCDYAMAAMEMGASAKQSVEIAKKLDIWTDGDILVKDLRLASDGTITGVEPLENGRTRITWLDGRKEIKSLPLRDFPFPRGEAL